jgi:Condensation domain
MVLLLARDECIVVLALDEMISDGVSTEVLTGELWALYSRGERELSAVLPPLEIQFADYAVWLERVYSHWKDRCGEYWRGRLSGAPPATIAAEGRFQRERPPRGAKVEFSFGRELSGKLRGFAVQHQLSPALIVLTVYVVVAARWIGQRDFVIQFVEHGRYRPELECMIGCLVHLLHLRIEILDGYTWLDLLQHVATEFRTACDHRDFNWAASLIPELTTDLHFNWLPMDCRPKAVRWKRSSEPLRIEPLAQPFPTRRELPPLKFLPYFWDLGVDIGATIVYRPDIFALDTVQQIGQQIQLLAKDLLAGPGAALRPFALYRVGSQCG